ncbi:hypothetical protein BN1723_016418 [Verticillium longisporum]|uniref:Uncharacterized protein n=1 Tax=Verticillium longisporum TaxID=100787 RepID=A0A0G4NED4_VERLO|nr:hypothetical protein BN1708_009464 [Verticillium longisporum]CRK44857.1 hypothetical protein BN1723_016418 [Verticillium longisporum]
MKASAIFSVLAMAAISCAHIIPEDASTNLLDSKPSVTLTLSMEIRIETCNFSVGIYYGPLLYALDFPLTKTEHQPLNWTDRKPLADTEVHPRARDHVREPIARWQYAINPDSVRVGVSEREGAERANSVFTRDGPPNLLTVDA